MFLHSGRVLPRVRVVCICLRLARGLSRHLEGRLKRLVTMALKCPKTTGTYQAWSGLPRSTKRRCLEFSDSASCILQFGQFAVNFFQAGVSITFVPPICFATLTLESLHIFEVATKIDRETKDIPGKPNLTPLAPFPTPDCPDPPKPSNLWLPLHTTCERRLGFETHSHRATAMLPAEQTTSTILQQWKWVSSGTSATQLVVQFWSDPRILWISVYWCLLCLSWLLSFHPRGSADLVSDREDRRKVISCSLHRYLPLHNRTSLELAG